MACSERWFELLSAWHDGEATPDEASLAREHLQRCGSCAASAEAFEELGAAMRALPEEGVPPRVRRRATALGPRRSWRRAASGALALAAASLVVLAWPGHRAGTALGDELEAHHLKAFSRASPCEFESSDPAAVAAWLAANVGYAVAVPAVPGAKLLGARRCRLRGGLTASVLYRRGDEALTLFLPRSGTPAGAEATRLAASGSRCTRAPLGDHVCAAPGRFAVAETTRTALVGLEAT